ncbi:hypothetical protein WS68_15935 [Burkholderia sp. TSV86]|nr:hypothetical protein WS68_15935 [Burkholderia sp. TSV86]
MHRPRSSKPHDRKPVKVELRSPPTIARGTAMGATANDAIFSLALSSPQPHRLPAAGMLVG